MKRLVLAALLAALATAARAESPRRGSFDISFGNYTPDMDAEFAGTTGPGPFERVFGTGRGWMFRIGVARSLFTGVGSLDVGFQTGYYRMSGNALSIDGTGAILGPSGDKTALHIIPTTITLTYRFDFLADRYGFPFAPYGRAALERYNWWVTSGSGSSTTGATNGYSLTGGIAFLLDMLDPELAHELDRDSGVNHTYLFFEARRSWIDDFGSSKSWDLSDRRLSFAGGMLFVF